MAIIISNEDVEFGEGIGGGIDNLSHLVDDCMNLNSGDLLNSFGDQLKLTSIAEKLIALSSVLQCTHYCWFSFVFCKSKALEENRDCNELSFEVTKNLRRMVKNIVLPNVETLLDSSKQWKFDDYRARNFQSDVRDEMEKIYQSVTIWLGNEE